MVQVYIQQVLASGIILQMVSNLGKKNMFPPTLPTLIFCAYPKVFLTIFEQALLKSECVPCRT